MFPSLRYPKRLRAILDHLSADRPEKIYLFGSWARGEGDELSDLDLVMIMKSEMSFLERTAKVMRSLPASVGAVDLLVYTPEEFRQMLRDGNAFAEMLVEEGKLIYGASSND